MKYDFSQHIGHSGLICQISGDQGDTCQRVGTFYFLAYILGLNMSYRNEDILTNFFSDIAKLTAGSFGSGRYRRHNNPNAGWYSDRQLSRDQKSILVLSMATYGLKSRIKEAFKDNTSRIFLHQNTLDDDGVSLKFPDVMVPNEFSVMIRGLEIWYLYPLLYILDLSFLLEIFIFRKTKLWDYDNMLCQQIMFAVLKRPTLISKLAFKLYQKTDFLDRIKAYHKDFSNGIPALYDMFVDANDKLIRGNYVKIFNTSSFSDFIKFMFH